MMAVSDAVTLGAEQIIRRCLGLSPGQELLVFVDETTVEVGIVLAEAAHRLKVPQTMILVPTALQRRICKKSDLSMLIQGAAKESRAILNCVAALPDCLPFRELILETNWSAHTRIGHMPGASFEVLKLANVNFEQLIEDCHRIELAMARGHEIEFISYASDGMLHQLKADIGGWERLPVASDGVISDGIWGNVPSGETYIAPIEGSGKGSVVINGSIPDLVIELGGEIVLHFERGHLTQIDPTDSPTARWLEKTHFQTAQTRGDSNWSNLAEIGVGVSPGVKRLTGNMLFDEKAAGTAHIALGSNTFMGGMVHATIHCDMVVKAPTIIIDGRTVLDRGELCSDESEWRENHAQVSLAESPLRAAEAVARSGIEVEFQGRRLQRTLRPEPGRKSACFVGDNETAYLACDLYTCLPAENEWLPIDELVARAQLEPETVRRVLHVMWSYDLVNVR